MRRFSSTTWLTSSLASKRRAATSAGIVITNPCTYASISGLVVTLTGGGVSGASAGTITIDGHDIVSDPLEAKRRLAFIPDEPQLFDYLTVVEHLRLVARLYGVGDVEVFIRKNVRERPVRLQGLGFRHGRKDPPSGGGGGKEGRLKEEGNEADSRS